MAALRTVSLSEIKPYKNNSKIHPKKQIEDLKRSILEYGYIQEIGLDEKNIIVFGHGRYFAIKELSKDDPKRWNKIKVKDLSHLSAAQKKKFRILDNKVSSNEYDDDRIKAEIDAIYKGILTPEKIMEDLGLSKKEVRKFIPMPETKGDDDVKMKVKAVSKPGDIWDLGPHRLICGDASSLETVAKIMDGNLIELVFTDPPYGVSYNSKNEFLNKADKGNSVQVDIQNDHAEIEDIKNLWLQSFKAFIPCLAEKSAYYICSAAMDETLLKMSLAIKESGLQLKHQIAWVKNNHVLGRTDYNYKHEPILYGWYKKHEFFGNGPQKFSVWNYNKPLKSELHPTMKPVDLIYNAIMNSTAGKGSIIFDGFAGSGSTLIAAEKSERTCYAVEIDPHYCDVIRDRYIKWSHDNSRTADIKLNGKDWSGK